MNDLVIRKWKRAGIAFLVPPAEESVDIESLLMETTTEGRSNPRLISAMATWLVHYGDLVCTKRLLSFLPKGNSGILAAVIEYAISKGADPKLAIVLKKCKKANGEFLYPHLCKYKVVQEYQIENAEPHLKKWGYFASEIGTKEDAMHTRDYVLEENQNLALRAVFGPGARADILFKLLGNEEISIRQLAAAAGYSYEPVYSEIKRLILNKIVLSRAEGRKLLISLGQPFKGFLAHIPV